MQALLHFSTNHSSVRFTKVQTACNSPHYEDTTEYRKLTSDGVELFDLFNGQKGLRVAPQALSTLTSQAFVDVAHLLRPAHLQQLSTILKDSEASVRCRK
jgi:hypothetical protein